MANGGIVKPCGLTLRDQNPAFRDPRLVLSGIDFQASNGVIHTINRVLLPAARFPKLTTLTPRAVKGRARTGRTRANGCTAGSTAEDQPRLAFAF